MHELTGLIDVCTWTGKWPFQHLRYAELGALKRKLNECGIETAFVSPIEAVFEQDPMRANRQLLQDIRRANGRLFSPVPVVDLSYGNWREAVELAAAEQRIRMVKLLPNYHMYPLDETTLTPLIEAAGERHLAISIQVRMEDPRGRYPFLEVESVDVAALIKTVSAFSDQLFVLNNCYRRELDAVLVGLPNVYVDIASLEIQDILRYLDQRHGLERFLFATHCPFYYPEGNLNKLRYADVAAAKVDAVARRNCLAALSPKHD